MPDAGPGTPDAAPSSPLAARFYALYEKFPRLKWGRADIPSTMVGAYWGVLLSAGFGLIAGLVLQGQMAWYRGVARDAVAQSVADGDDPPLTMPTDSELRGMLVFNLVAIAIVALALVIIASSISRGKPSSRWFLVAVWAVATTGIMAGLAFFGIPQAINLAVNGAPILLVIPSLICSILLLFALGSLLSKPSRRFFSAEKAVLMEQAVANFEARRQARAQAGPRPGLFGRRRGFAPSMSDEAEPEAEFAPRPPRPGTEGTPKRKAARQAAAGGEVSLVKGDGTGGGAGNPGPGPAASDQGGDPSGATTADVTSRRTSAPRSKSRSTGG